MEVSQLSANYLKRKLSPYFSCSYEFLGLLEIDPLNHTYTQANEFFYLILSYEQRAFYKSGSLLETLHNT